MKDDCLLGNDFLLAINFEEGFASFFGIPSQREKENSFCSRIMRESDRVPQFLKKLFKERETQDLNEKERFANFLNEFWDVFSEEITAGNHKVEHKDKRFLSNRTNSSPHTFSFAGRS